MLAAFGQPGGLVLSPRDERAGGVDDGQVALGGLGLDLGGRAVRGDDDHVAWLRPGQRGDLDGAKLGELGGRLGRHRDRREQPHGVPGASVGGGRAAARLQRVHSTAAPRARRGEQRASTGRGGPFLDRGAGVGGSELVLRRSGRGDGAGPAVLLPGREHDGRVPVPGRVVAPRDRRQPNLTAPPHQRACHQRRRTAAQRALGLDADQPWHQHLAALRADAGRLDLACCRVDHPLHPPEHPD